MIDRRGYRASCSFVTGAASGIAAAQIHVDLAVERVVGP